MGRNFNIINQWGEPQKMGRTKFLKFSWGGWGVGGSKREHNFWLKFNEGKTWRRRCIYIYIILYIIYIYIYIICVYICVYIYIYNGCKTTTNEWWKTLVYKLKFHVSPNYKVYILILNLKFKTFHIFSCVVWLSLHTWYNIHNILKPTENESLHP